MSVRGIEKSLTSFCERYNRNVEEMTKVLAYFAGFVDGEGCISIVKHKPQPGRPNYYFYLAVRVVNTDRRPIELLQNTFGGWIKVVNGTGSWKTRYEWVAECGTATKTLELLLPYLLVKREQAKVGLKFSKHKKDTHRVGRRRLNHNQIMTREAYWKKMLTLNHRGVS